MKNLLKYILISLVLVGISSCAKEEIGGTAVQDMCGEWYVTVDAADASGNVTMEDPFGMGYFPIFTYNTNKNTESEMYIDDQGNFWEFRVIANVNYAAKTFSATSAADDYNGITVDVMDGKVVKDGAKSQSGYTADGISFLVKFSDDENAGQAYDYLLIHGYRRTGLNGGHD